MFELILVRHAQAEWNVSRKFQGQADSGLTQAAQHQIRDCREHLRRYLGKPTRVWASDTKRAVETARGLFPDSPEIVRDPRLRELDVGELAGRPVPDPLSGDHPFVSPSGALLVESQVGGGESLRDLERRCLSAIDDVLAFAGDSGAHVVGSEESSAAEHSPSLRQPAGRLVVVTHANPIRVIVAHALGIALESSLCLDTVGNCSVTSLGYSARLGHLSLRSYGQQVTPSRQETSAT